MRTSGSDRSRSGRLISLFQQNHEDFRALELALEEGDLAGARRALARCLQTSRDKTKAADATSGSPAASPSAPMAALLLKTDLSLLADAFRTGELPARLAPGASRPARKDEGGDEAEFIRDLFDALGASQARRPAERVAPRCTVHKLFKDQ